MCSVHSREGGARVGQCIRRRVLVHEADLLNDPAVPVDGAHELQGRIVRFLGDADAGGQGLQLLLTFLPLRFTFLCLLWTKSIEEGKNRRRAFSKEGCTA